jgi:hypothetical protein
MGKNITLPNFIDKKLDKITTRGDGSRVYAVNTDGTIQKNYLVSTSPKHDAIPLYVNGSLSVETNSENNSSAANVKYVRENSAAAIAGLNIENTGAARTIATRDSNNIVDEIWANGAIAADGGSWDTLLGANNEIRKHLDGNGKEKASNNSLLAGYANKTIGHGGKDILLGLANISGGTCTFAANRYNIVKSVGGFALGERNQVRFQDSGALGRSLITSKAG